MAIFGTRPTNQSVAPQLVISGLESMAEQFEIDPSLPVLGQDPFLPNSDLIVIPRGRLVGVKNPQGTGRPTYAQEEKALVTLANGTEGMTINGISTDVAPIGFAETPYFRSFAEQIQPRPGITKGKLLSIPYIQTSNGAYGAIKPGDYVTAYAGTTSSGAPIAQEVGKIVRFVEKAVFLAHQSNASTTIQLTQAVLPAFQPRIYAANNGGAYVPLTSAAYSFNGGNWQAVLNAAVTDVFYEWGQGIENRAGQCISFQAVGNAGGALDHLHSFPGWLQWVKDNYDAWTVPPLTLPRPATQILNEVPTMIGPNVYRLAQYPIVPLKTIAVSVTGTRTDPNTGVTATLTNYILPLAANTWLEDYTYGQDYIVNPLTGVLTIESDIVVNSLTVSYSADVSYLDGKIWNPGVLGLTDGRYSGVAGTPAHLELLGVVADMHVAIF
jgi:hypothetical protein